MTVDGVFKMYVGQGSAVGLTLSVQLFEGQAIQAAGASDYEPFYFYWTEHGGNSGDGNVPGLIQYDTNGWLNPSTHAFSGGTFGSGTVAAYASIVIPQDGYYWSQAQVKVSATDTPGSGQGVDFSIHMGCNSDLLDGAVGYNWSQSDDSSLPDFTVYHPRPLSGNWLLAFNAGDVIFWALHNNSTTASIDAFQFVWQLGYYGPLV